MAPGAQSKYGSRGCPHFLFSHGLDLLGRDSFHQTRRHDTAEIELQLQIEWCAMPQPHSQLNNQHQNQAQFDSVSNVRSGVSFG